MLVGDLKVLLVRFTDVFENIDIEHFMVLKTIPAAFTSMLF